MYNRKHEFILLSRRSLSGITVDYDLVREILFVVLVIPLVSM